MKFLARTDLTIASYPAKGRAFHLAYQVNDLVAICWAMKSTTTRLPLGISVYTTSIPCTVSASDSHIRVCPAS